MNRRRNSRNIGLVLGAAGSFVNTYIKNVSTNERTFTVTSSSETAASLVVSMRDGTACMYLLSRRGDEVSATPIVEGPYPITFTQITDGIQFTARVSAIAFVNIHNMAIA